MSSDPPTYFHGTFTLRRNWRTTPARVFAAWADVEFKAKWFPGLTEGWTLIRRELDFRPGGREILEGRFHATGKTALYEARFHLIEPNRRLIYDYDLRHGDMFHSVTLSSLEIEPEGAGVRVAYTEQIVFLDGKDGVEGRKNGTGSQWKALESALLDGALS